MQLDLFTLHDPLLDDAPRKWIAGKGKELKQALGELIDEIAARGLSKAKLCRHLMKKFGISKPTAERIVYLRKEFYPLVFIEQLLNLANKPEKRFFVQKKIEFLKTNQPPEKVVKAPKVLTKNLCKIAGAHAADGTLAGNFFCITDEHKTNIDAFGKWVEKEFGLSYAARSKSEHEWAIAFNNKIFGRYLHKIFGFCNGNKIYTVNEPQIIKKSTIELRKSFALGALTFEAGVGMKNQVEFCVASKKFQEDICQILEQTGVKFHKMEKQSGRYWRFWSNSLTKDETIKWMQLFEPQTEKWLKLYESINGYRGAVNSINDAIDIFDRVYPHKSASKVSLKKVLLAIMQLKETHRYKLAEYLAKEAKLKSFGGRWAHGLRHYLDILKQANIISTERREFGKKKSFGTIIREVYIFNPEISGWKVPFRNQKAAADVAKNLKVCSPFSTA